MRGAPQKGLAAAILLIRARTSGLVSGRPLRFRLQIQVQKSRKPLRCQDTTVSGLTMIKARRQYFQFLERGIARTTDLPFAVAVGDSAA